MKELIMKLYENKNLTDKELLFLIAKRECEDLLFSLARKRQQEFYGNRVYIRGLIEISNICKNDCLYCGIRKSNKNAQRYRLTTEEILSSADKGYALGFRTFVLQGGEDPFFSDEYLVPLIEEIKSKYPDVAVTLSLGERSYESYLNLKKAGADRYLLREETATESHYRSLHPEEMSFSGRMKCLNDLKKIGYQTGCGFLVGSPGQSYENIVADLRFLKEFSPHMIGIGPFIPHKDTPFCDCRPGDTNLTVYLISILRLMMPGVLLPATTALASLSEDGRARGILAGANVIMPNLSPEKDRAKYSLYNNKAYTGCEDANELESLKKSMKAIGYEISTDRGDSKIH